MNKILNTVDKFVTTKTLVIIPISLFIYGGRKVFFPEILQQDDLRELDVKNLQNFSCVWHEGDNHPLWSSIIWIISKTGMPTQSVIVFLNILISISSLLLIYYFLERKYSKLYALLGSSILANSFVFTYYSSNLKQYQIEILYSIIALVLYERLKVNKKGYYQFILLATFFGLLSKTTILVSLLLILALAINSIEYKGNLFLYFLLLSVPSFLLINEKISRETYIPYWNEFFININSFLEFINSISFLSSLFMKGLFGNALWRIGLLIFLFSLVYSLIRRQETFSAIVIFSLLGCSILKLYPLGAGRTDIIFYPFVLVLIVGFISEIKTIKDPLVVLPLMILIVSSSFIDAEPIYKKEYIDRAVYQVFSEETDSIVLVSDEQYVGFTHYAKEIFGEKIDDNNIWCGKKIVNNSRIYNLQDGYDKGYIERLNIPPGISVWVVGIELKETNGRFRLAEDYLSEKGYKKIAEHRFDIGIYAIEYKK